MTQDPKRPTLLLIDNYDSFTYNLVDYLEQIGANVKVVRNDALSIEELTAIDFDGIVLSPGPETPLEAGITLAAIEHYYKKIPILGVCLGHQALGMYFGAQLERAPYPVHGKTSPIFQHQPLHPLFNGISSPFEVMRYHSLMLTGIEKTPLRVLAATVDDVIMAIEHPSYPLTGFQFHPESILTDVGINLLRNWLTITFPSTTSGLEHPR